MDCPVLRECKVCGEHKPQTDFYKLAPTKRAKKDILGVGRISRCRNCEISKYLNMDPRLKLLYAARNRAKRNGLECTITATLDAGRYYYNVFTVDGSSVKKKQREGNVLVNASVLS